MPLAVLGALCASGALAEDRAPDRDDTSLETVIVTGRETGAGVERASVAFWPKHCSRKTMPFFDSVRATQMVIASVIAR